MDQAGEGELPLGITLDSQIGIQVDRHPVIRQWAGFAGGQCQIDGHALLQQIHRASGGHGSGVGAAFKFAEMDCLAIGLHQCGDLGEVGANAEVLHFAAGQLDAAYRARFGQGASEVGVDGNLSAQAAALRGQQRVQQFQIDVAVGMEVE